MNAHTAVAAAAEHQLAFVELHCTKLRPLLVNSDLIEIGTAAVTRRALLAESWCRCAADVELQL